MNGKKLFRALRNIDPQLILDADPNQKRRVSHYVWIKWGALAACLCFVIVATVLLLIPESPVTPFPHEHVFGEWKTIKEASCSAQGEEVRVCSCGEQENRYTALLPHFAGAWVIEKEPTIKLPTPDDPDEREPGIKCQFCERCGAKLDEELIPAMGSLGLAYAINPDGKTFSVAGIGNCIDTDIIIPENFCGYHVTAIGKNAFKGREDIKSITFPETITVIGERAFYECRSLESLTLPSGLLEIGNFAFSCCHLLKEIVVPQSVTKIGAGAFSEMYNLEKVVLPDALTEIAGRLFAYDIRLKEIKLPEGITSIGEAAFYNCAIKSIDIPKSVTRIGSEAFWQCSVLASIVLPEGIEIIERDTFAYCSKLASVTIPDSVTSIEWGAFSHCYALSEIVIPSGVKVIGQRAFESCSALTRVVLPEGLEGIGRWAFHDCYRLSKMKIPDSVTYIEMEVFDGCTNLVQIENGVCYVDNWAVDFKRGFVDVALREGTVGIAYWTFETPGAMETLTLPNSLKHIGLRAFSDTVCLKQILFEGTQEEWDAIHKTENWDDRLYNVVVTCIGSTEKE